MKQTKTQVAKKGVLTKMDVINYSIDGAGKTLGRVSSDAAMALMGKKSALYEKNAVLNVQVEIKNAAKIILTEKRMRDKTYLSYTGYPGGLYTTSLPEMVAKKGRAEVIRRAVMGMIPRNHIRKERMKRLTIVD